jgi:hypothetical protein
METEALSKRNAIDDLRRYFVSRMDWRITLLLPALLLALSRWGSSRLDADSVLTDWLTCLTWIVSFRLADDLADRKLDQTRHADRVLCTTRYVAAFKTCLAILILLGMVTTFAFQGIESLVLLAAYGVLLTSWYLGRKRSGLGAVWNYHVVLLKYAVLTLSLIDSTFWLRTPKPILVAFIAYWLVCVFEVLHDADLRCKPVARRAAMWEVGLIVLATCFAFTWTGTQHLN